MAAPKDTCSRCGKELDTDTYPRWCKACKKEYNEEYYRTRKEMTETRGFAAGISAAKDHIARKFEGLPSGVLITGADAARWVRGEQIPLARD